MLFICSKQLCYLALYVCKNLEEYVYDELFNMSFGVRVGVYVGW